MKKILLTFTATTLAALSLPALAQPGGPGGPGGGRGSANAVLSAIDADGNHEISAEEMKNAMAALKTLDADKDGKLMRDEIHPELAGRDGGQGGPGGRGGPGGGGFGGRRGGPGGGEPANASGFAERIMAFDSNKDGKLSKEELPERMQTVLARYDADKNGSLDKAEVAKLSEQPRAGRGGGPGGPEGRGGGPGGREGRGGPPTPEEFVTNAMEFDADKDGKLSKDELAKFAEDFAQREPRGGGRGGFGEGRGGRGGGRGNGGGDRPQRPARPE